MTVRHMALAACAVLVFGLGVYLFVEVRSTPAVAEADDLAPRDARPSPTVPVPSTPSRAGGFTSSDAGGGTAVVLPSVVRKHLPPKGNDVEPTPVADPAEAPRVDVKADSVMAEANKAYDRGDFDDAKTIAQKVLATQPGNVRMLRILVSASCIDGDNDLAQKHFLDLPPPDREQMKVRCARYGVTFPDVKPDTK